MITNGGGCAVAMMPPQRTYSSDRFGNIRGDWVRAMPEFNFPLSFNVPHAMINSAFRRSALVDVGGFDEEFEYYFDETDLMVRLVDRGWQIAQTDRGFVHHKYLPSAVRNEKRVLTSWYSVVKNRAYFARSPKASLPLSNLRIL